ncbi:MAG: hypothetical protein U1E36_00415 [Rickettsiales bacterium]
MQNHALHYTLIGSGVLATAIAVTPFVLPGLGFGMNLNGGNLEQEIAFAHCGGGAPTGLAGAASHAVSYIPFIGDTLAKGGILNAVAAGITALGGLKIANWLKEAVPQAGWITWSGTVKALTIATTALIALPAILPAISMGIDYLSILAGNSWHDDPVYYRDYTQPVIDTIGKLGKEGVMAGGIGAASSLVVSHLLACGVGIAGASASIAAGASQHGVTPKTSIVSQGAERQPLQRISFAIPL